MSDRAYNRIANILMLIGIGSALAFDSGKVPHVLVGTIGIVAGVGAALLYFFNSKNPAAKEEVTALGVMRKPRETASAVTMEGIGFAPRADSVFVSYHRPERVFWERQTGFQIGLVEMHRRKTAELWLSGYAADYARKLRWGVVESMAPGKALMEPEVELSPNEVAACAVEIMRALAANDELNRWEYAMGSKGLRISLKRSSAMHVTEIAQEDLDFGDLASGYEFSQAERMKVH